MTLVMLLLLLLIVRNLVDYFFSVYAEFGWGHVSRNQESAFSNSVISTSMSIWGS